jgi:hypothetical protein
LCGDKLTFIHTFLLLFLIGSVSAFGFPSDAGSTVFFGNITNLSEMQDVNIPAPADGEALVFDLASMKWIAGAAAGAETFWNANYSNFLLLPSWANVMNGTVIANIPIYLNDTFRGNYSNFSGVYGYALNASQFTYANALNGTLMNNSWWNSNYSANDADWRNRTNLSYLTSFTELDPYWSDNFTKYNSSWSNTTNLSYLTSENLWNANYSNFSTKIFSWDLNYSTYLLKPVWSDVMNGTVVSNIPIYLNDTFRNNYSAYLLYLNYHFNNTFAYYNSTNAPIYLNDTFRSNITNFTAVYGYALNASVFWNNNYSDYLLKPSWANAMNGTLLQTSTWNTNYSTNNDNWLNRTNLSYLTSESLWNGNYSNFSTKIFNWDNNYSTYLTKPIWADVMNNTLWARAMNNTLLQTTQAYNGTLAKVGAINTFTANQTLSGMQYITNGTATSFIVNNGSGWLIKS